MMMPSSEISLATEILKYIPDEVVFWGEGKGRYKTVCSSEALFFMESQNSLN